MSDVIALSNRILPSDSAHGDYFGYDVAVFGPVFVASSIGNNVNGPYSGRYLTPDIYNICIIVYIRGIVYF